MFTLFRKAWFLWINYCSPPRGTAGTLLSTKVERDGRFEAAASGFVAPGKLSSGQFSAENGRMPWQNEGQRNVNLFLFRSVFVIMERQGRSFPPKWNGRDGSFRSVFIPRNVGDTSSAQAERMGRFLSFRFRSAEQRGHSLLVLQFQSLFYASAFHNPCRLQYS